MIRIFIAYLLIIPVLIGCDESIKLDIDQMEPKVVIEGLITNAFKNHYVKVSFTKEFYQSGSTYRIVDAVVVVTDEDNNTYAFTHNPNNHELLDGYYLSDIAFAGEVGKEYTLTVTYNGQIFQATDQLLPVTTIDSLGIRLNTDELEDPEVPGRVFEVLFYAREPQDRIDYYLFKFYRNGAIVHESESDIYFAEDKFLGENIDDLPIADFYAIGDTVKVEMYSLSKNGFIYYTDMFNVLNNDGGMFGPIPNNPRNNISNGALGYFQTSSVDSETIVVKKPG